jgi:hypothetical protein
MLTNLCGFNQSGTLYVDWVSFFYTLLCCYFVQFFGWVTGDKETKGD